MLLTNLTIIDLYGCFYRYLASGDCMASMHYQYLVGATTVSNIIKETCKIIWKKLAPIVLPFPLCEEDWLNIADDFKKYWNFDHCLGACDGKHCTIQVKFITSLHHL